MTKPEIEQILSDVNYKNWSFIVGEKQGVLYLQLQWSETDSYGGQSELQNSRKWILSEFMTKSEVVQTAFKAVLTAEEHEARENFKYRSRRIFGPHFDVDRLHEITIGRNQDYRK